MTTLDTAEVRSKTADILRERGWAQGDYLANAGRPYACEVCLVEAIGQAVGLPPLSMSIAHRSRMQTMRPDLSEQFAVADTTIDQLATKLGHNPETSTMTPQAWLMDWNDNTVRTVGDVLAALEGQAV